MSPQVSFLQIVAAKRKGKAALTPDWNLLALDPGETTGWAQFMGGNLIAHGFLGTGTFEQAVPEVTKLIDTKKPDHIRIEDYKVYPWLTQQHTFSSLHTPQLIGAIETLAVQRGIRTSREMAQRPKNFCTDDKLKMWGMYVTNKHARDAIRHGCFYFLTLP